MKYTPPEPNRTTHRGEFWTKDKLIAAQTRAKMRTAWERRQYFAIVFASGEVVKIKTITEASRVLGLKPNTLKMYLWRSKGRLRTMLNGEMVELRRVKLVTKVDPE